MSVEQSVRGAEEVEKFGTVHDSSKGAESEDSGFDAPGAPTETATKVLHFTRRP